MGSSKKKGQQRKAAAKRAQSTDAVTVSGCDNSGIISGGDSCGGGINAKTLAKIRSGDNKATKKLLSGLGFISGTNTVLFERSGALSVVLGFLKRCEDETFDQVMAIVGGDLKTPSTWIHILSTGSLNEPSCKLQIVKNIGPLVRCMMNDTDRLLFKSSKHWRQGIVGFVNLVGHVIQSLLQEHEGVLESIIQWAFWLEYRPDIVKELKSEGLKCTGIVTAGRLLTEVLVNGSQGESRILLLKTIGTTPIVNKEYDPSCMVSYTAGLVHQLKLTDRRTGILDKVRRLIREADCVDKGVITELIDFGTKYTPNHESALDVALIIFSMTLENSNLKKNHPNDTRVACAIRAGLIEMCLGFTKQFAEHISFGGSEFPLHSTIICMFQSINNVSLHKKSAKAIRHKKNDIKGKLVSLEEDQQISNNPACKEILDMVRSIIDMNGSYCCRCNKSLSKTEVMECNGCHRMAYCSKACQKEDWMNGHNVTCCKTYTDETAGQFQGRYIPKEVPSDERAAAKLKEIEINMNMIQLKLFLDNSETILAQAEDLGIPLHDCVVYFHLAYSPKVTIRSYTEVYTAPEARKAFEETRSKENIMCAYLSSIYAQGLEEDLFMQRFFPHEWLVKQTTLSS